MRTSAFIAVLLCAVFAPLIAAEPDAVAVVADAAADAAAEGGWLETIGTIIGSVVALVLTYFGAKVTAYVGKYTSEKAAEARANAEKEGVSKLGQMRYLGEAELYAAVGELNETEMPKLFAAAQDGKITKEEASTWLHGLKDKAIELATKRLAAQGIDLVADLGVDWVHGKIRQIVDEKSPFLGPTVDALFDKGGDFVSDYGKKLLGQAVAKIGGGDAPAPAEQG